MKPKYQNEANLLKYIKSLVNHRDNKKVLQYINTKLAHYSFSEEFINQCNQIKAALESNSKPDVPDLEDDSPKIEPLPQIYFNQLSEDLEKEHLFLTKKHAKNAEASLFDEIDRTNSRMKDLRLDIRYSNYEDRADLIKQHLDIAHRKEDLQYEARFVTAAINNPYFGRFDFKNSDEQERILYISKTNLPTYVQNHHKVHFINWREPIADVFYRYQSPTDDVSFKNDAGETIHGDMALTARFTIENGILTNISYSASHNDNAVSEASDTILQNKLSQNSNERMTEIVETIQPEQNNIVRHNPNEDMIIQGVAGSGKTAVALHRIAYIVYQKPELRHGGIIFISPNEAFSKYVSDVLPELGEFFIPIMTFNDVINYTLRGKTSNLSRYQSETIQEFVEKYYKTNTLDKNIKQKFTVAFIKKFYSLCRRIEKEGELIRRYLIARDEITTIQKDIAVYKKLIKIAKEDKLSNYIQEQKNLKANLSNYRRILASIRKKIEQNPETYSLGIGKGEEAGKVVISLTKKPIEYYETICDGERINKKSYENAPFLAVLQFLIDKANGENHEDLSVRHIVIDEAQDYTEPYIFFLRIAYPNAVFTILGDTNQNINPYYMHGSLEKMLLDTKYFEMDKAYRSSPEIINFCNNILGITSVKAVRHSNGETVEQLTSPSDGIETIKPAVDYYRSKGYQRIGIITRDQESADDISRSIKDQQLIILPVYQAKGLEFDAAIVINDFNSREKELFYVACSRAQHGLTIVKRKKPEAKTKKATTKKTTTKTAKDEPAKATPTNSNSPHQSQTEESQTRKTQTKKAPTQKPQTQSSTTSEPSPKPQTQPTDIKPQPTPKTPTNTAPTKKNLFSKLKSAAKAAFKAFNE